MAVAAAWAAREGRRSGGELEVEGQRWRRERRRRWRPPAALVDLHQYRIVLTGRGGGAAARWRVGEKEAGEEVVGEGGGAAAGMKEENEDF